MNKYELAEREGELVGEAISYLRFLPATNNFISLFMWPSKYFRKYVPSDDMYERGQVVRGNTPETSHKKYLLQGDGRIDKDKPLDEQSLLKLFIGDVDGPYVREEFVMQGCNRYWLNPGRPEEDGWYKLIVPWLDDATPPPNAPQNWERQAI